MNEKATSLNFKTLTVDKAVGEALAHVMTEIIPGKSKGSIFKKGHTVLTRDLAGLSHGSICQTANLADFRDALLERCDK